MGAQIKKKTRSFSLTDDEFNSVLSRAEAHGFDRNEYLIALIEADQRIPLEVMLDPATKRRILRPMGAAPGAAPLKEHVERTLRQMQAKKPAREGESSHTAR